MKKDGPDISKRLFISTIAENAAELARQYDLGLEVAEFCTALNMDQDFETWDSRVKRQMNGVNRFMFHAPFNELCPAAVDPLIKDIAARRYAQAYALTTSYGINSLIVHSGFMPVLYHEGWFMENSVKFWKNFLADKPDNFALYLENVFEETPELLCAIVRETGDKRFRLCLDIGHVRKCGQNTGLDDWRKRMSPWLGHIHLHNNDGKYDAHNALGDGVINVAAFIREVAHASPDVTFTIETSAAKASIEWLQANGFMR